MTDDRVEPSTPRGRLRLAQPSDAAQVAALMRASVLALVPRWYDERQTASAAVHVAHLDSQLIEDGTYFVQDVAGEIVACGGWSTATLAAGEDAARAEGFRSLVLGATLPGVPLYRSFGFVEVERGIATMPDGVPLEIVTMERPLGSGAVAP